MNNLENKNLSRYLYISFVKIIECMRCYIFCYTRRGKEKERLLFCDKQCSSPKHENTARRIVFRRAYSIFITCHALYRKKDLGWKRIRCVCLLMLFSYYYILSATKYARAQCNVVFARMALHLCLFSHISHYIFSTKYSTK